MSKDTSKPAFPSPMAALSDGGVVDAVDLGQEGMTLRDYFAAKAMQGLIAVNATYDGAHDLRRLIRDAFLHADVMLDERSK